jgi:cell division septation protein DedD
LAQDDYYYEIQLTNKQLVFYFMAGAAGLILSFLAGVMVGRSVEGSAAGAGDTRTVAEERVVAEQSPSPATGTPEPGYTYPRTLEGERPDDRLERPGGAAAAPSPTPTPRPAPPAATARPTATPTPAPTLPPPPPPRAAALPKPLASTASGFAIQVGAFKDKASADGVVKNLKARGLPAYAITPTGGGLFTVRVGVYRDRADAEAVQDRLRDDKFKPYILKQ